MEMEIWQIQPLAWSVIEQKETPPFGYILRQDLTHPILDILVDIWFKLFMFYLY
jgi:hypothetical protein